MLNKQIIYELFYENVVISMTINVWESLLKDLENRL